MGSPKILKRDTAHARYGDANQQANDGETLRSADAIPTIRRSHRPERIAK